MEEIVSMLILLLNGFSILILLVGVVKTTVDFIKNETRGTDQETITRSNNQIKVYLGSYILLSLEVLIASDIIETIMNPSIEDILILAGIVVIRTAISYFLGKEIESVELDKK